MTYQTKSIVVLDLEKDIDVIQKYNEDECWIRKEINAFAVSYECKSPILILEDAIYLPNNKMYEKYMNERIGMLK